MTRSSAAQEPSMDEILASIRRIIENGDERPDGASPARSRPERSALVERLEAQAEGGDNVVARLTPDISFEAAEPVVSPVSLSASSIFSASDEDDLAARLRSEIEADGLIEETFLSEGLLGLSGVLPSERAVAAPADDLSPAASPPALAEGAPQPAVERAAPAVAPVTAADRPSWMRLQPARSEPTRVPAPEVPVARKAEETAATAPATPAAMAEPAPAPAAEAAAAPFVAANTDSPRMQEFRSAVLDDLIGGGRAEGSSALVSGRTGELVGASFEELTKAIREGELRSLEGMAQDLLRPMLQEWLDDNLPKMVERMVREEIERVARGGRR